MKLHLVNNFVNFRKLYTIVTLKKDFINIVGLNLYKNLWLTTVFVFYNIGPIALEGKISF